MKARLYYDRSMHALSSSLAMFAQRMPLVKNICPLLSSPLSLNVATPMTVSFISTHSLSGQSVFIVPEDPIIEVEDPAIDGLVEGQLNEEFKWEFTTNKFIMRSVTTEGLPAGLSVEVGTGADLGFSTIEGTPSEAGEFTVTLVAWRFDANTSAETPPYTLIINIPAPSSPFTAWQESNFDPTDLGNPDIVGPNADPDKDGIENLLEFVLELDPNVSSQMPGEFITDPEDDTLFKYEIPLSADAIDLNVVFQESSTLKPDEWTDVSEANFQRTDTSIVLSAPKVSGKKLYRLRVVL